MFIKFIRFLILVAVVVLTVFNAHAVRVAAFSWEAYISLAVIVFVTFFSGFLFGALWLTPSLWRSRREKKAKEKEIRKLTDHVAELQKRIVKNEKTQQKGDPRKLTDRVADLHKLITKKVTEQPADKSPAT